MTKNLALEMAEKATAARLAVERAGLSLPARPGFEIPRLPLKITDLNDDRLMGLFVALTRWTDHLAGAVAEAEIEERAAEAILNKAQALVLLRDWGGGRDDKVTLAKAQRDVDPEVEKRQELYDTAHAKRKMIAVLFSSTERDAAVVSRELTRRVGRREDHDRRVSRWTP
jgi:hypothetical protein